MSWNTRPRIRKYRQGERLDSLIAAVVAITLSDQYLFVRGKPYHPAVARNWSITQLNCLVRGGVAYIAELTPEWLQAEADKAEIAAEAAAEALLVKQPDFAEA